MKSGMVNDNAALRHHLFEIAQTQGVSKIPANTLHDDIDGIMQPFEGVSDHRHDHAASQRKQHVT